MRADGSACCPARGDEHEYCNSLLQWQPASVLGIADDQQEGEIREIPPLPAQPLGSLIPGYIMRLAATALQRDIIVFDSSTPPG